MTLPGILKANAGRRHLLVYSSNEVDVAAQRR